MVRSWWRLCGLFLTTIATDFCLWAPAEPGKTVGQIEGEMIAWCSKPGHGARLIPDGALQGIQFLRTPDYIQVVGFIDQTKINMASDDYGGEMDPHGADLVRGPSLHMHWILILFLARKSYGRPHVF